MNDLRKSRALNYILTNVNNVLAKALCEQNDLHDRIAELEHAMDAYQAMSRDCFMDISHCCNCLFVCESRDMEICDTCDKDYCKRCTEGKSIFICTSCTTNRT